MKKGTYKHSEEVKRKMSYAKGGEKHPLFGKHPSEETRTKISESHKGEKHYNWKGGLCENRAYVSWVKNKRNRMPKEGGHTWEEWGTLKAQYNWVCPSCKKQEPEIKLTQDHIIPLSKGGSDNIENIQPLCMPCNARKHTNIIRY